jgi:S-adenosylmethionine decarboxylase proenzyme
MLKNKPESFLGHQTHVELYGCPSELIDDEVLIEKILLEVTNIIGLTVVNSTIHHFSPIGVSGIVVIEESHLAIHTWPEYNYVAIDFFTYQKIEIDNGIDYIRKKLKASSHELNVLKRGAISKITKQK